MYDKITTLRVAEQLDIEDNNSRHNRASLGLALTLREGSFGSFVVDWACDLYDNKCQPNLGPYGTNLLGLHGPKFLLVERERAGLAWLSDTGVFLRHCN